MTTGAADILIGSEGRTDLLDLGRAGGVLHAARSPRQLFWRRFRSDRFALAALVFVVLLALVAIAAPLIVKLAGVPGPYVQNLNATDAFGSPLGPSAARSNSTGITPAGRPESSVSSRALKRDTPASSAAIPASLM